MLSFPLGATCPEKVQFHCAFSYNFGFSDRALQTGGKMCVCGAGGGRDY